MKKLLLAAAAALSLSACGGASDLITQWTGVSAEQQKCILAGLTSADLAELDLAKAQAIAAKCTVTVQSVIETVNEEAAK